MSDVSNAPPAEVVVGSLPKDLETKADALVRLTFVGIATNLYPALATDQIAADLATNDHLDAESRPTRAADRDRALAARMRDRDGVHFNVDTTQRARHTSPV